MSFEGVDKDKEISRRQAIGLLAGAGAGVMLGCGGGTKTSTSTTTSTAAASNTSYTVTPEGEEGPYFVDDSAAGFSRSDIRSNLDGTNTQSGIPLALSIYAYDSENSCAAIPNVQIDIWHCNGSGIYSAEDVEDTSWRNLAAWLPDNRFERPGHLQDDHPGMVCRSNHSYTSATCVRPMTPLQLAARIPPNYFFPRTSSTPSTPPSARTARKARTQLRM